MNLRTAILSATVYMSATTSALASESDVRRAVAAYEAKYDALSVKHDISGLAKLMNDSLTADFMATDADGNIQRKSRADAVGAITGAMRQIRVPKADSQILGVEARTNAATVTVRTTMTMTQSKDNSPDKMAQKVLATRTKEETWIKTKGGWRLKASKTLTSTIQKL